MICERCGATIDRKSTTCRPCFAERQRARAAIEREDADEELLRLVELCPYSEIARERHVTVPAIAQRVKAAEKRQAYLRRVRLDR